MTLSAAIIVKDEAARLDACLTSLRGLVDEIVVVDTGSIDGSVAVAEQHGAVLGYEPWQGDFATPRNRSLDLATGDWILYVDADEQVRGDFDGVGDARPPTTSTSALGAVRPLGRLDAVPRVPPVAQPARHPLRGPHPRDHRPGDRAHGRRRPPRGRPSWIASPSTTSATRAIVPTNGAHDEPLLLAELERHPDRPFVYDHLAPHVYEAGGDGDHAVHDVEDGHHTCT